MVEFNTDGWTQATSFCGISAPALPGVYAIVLDKFHSCDKPLKRDAKHDYRVLYIGQSQNLSKRITPNHEIYRQCYNECPGRCKEDDWNIFYCVKMFYMALERDIRGYERYLIESYNPPYNIIGRVRGK